MLRCQWESRFFFLRLSPELALCFSCLSCQTFAHTASFKTQPAWERLNKITKKKTVVLLWSLSEFVEPVFKYYLSTEVKTTQQWSAPFNVRVVFLKPKKNNSIWLRKHFKLYRRSSWFIYFFFAWSLIFLRPQRECIESLQKIYWCALHIFNLLCCFVFFEEVLCVCLAVDLTFDSNK